MDELKTNARALIDRARPHFTPSGDDLERLRRRLSAGPMPPDDGGGEPSETPHTPHEVEASGDARVAPKAANWAWYAGVLVVAGFLGAGASVLLSDPTVDAAKVTESAPVRHRNDADATTLTPVSGGAAAESVPLRNQRPSATTPSRVPVPAPKAPSASPASAHPPTAPSQTVEPRSSSKRSSRHEEPPARSDSDATPDTFAVELELIVAARKSLEVRSFTAARKAADRYLRRFDGGSFREEAEVLRLLASCGIERTDTLAERARAYVARRDSAFARRVRLACLGDPR